MYDREKILFVSDIERKINGLNFQRERIFSLDNRELWNRKVSPVHDVDFYVIILRRLYRELISKKYDKRVADLISENKDFLDKTEVRHDFEHFTEDKMTPTKVADLPPGAVSAPEGSEITISTSLINKVIVSGVFQWNLDSDHNKFIIIMKKFIELFPFTGN